MAKSIVHRIDCMELMATYPDKYFELAIVDPPYGVGLAKNGKIHENWQRVKGFKNLSTDYGSKDWDIAIPTESYFIELKRISKNQIVWGGNFFANYLGAFRNYIVWYKMGNCDNKIFSPTELAWTSFETNPKYYNIYWNGFGYINSDEEKIHPTQKPVELYKNILNDYAKEGDKIFDSHMGSQSSRIACWDMGFDYIGCEIDKDYFEAGNKRFELFKSQLKLEFAT